MSSASILRPPFAAWTPQAILVHFQSRSGVRFFPVIDDEQASTELVRDLLSNRFRFNSESYELPACFEWTLNPSQDREWLILLHKFYYAVGLGREYHCSQDRRYLDKWVELTSTWIDTVPLDFLTSDVMGRRVQNWVFAYYYFVTQNKSPLAPEFHLKLLASLHSQVTHLCEHLTPARNHRTIELYAIFLAAIVFPEMREAAEWLTFSRRLLLENMQSDLLSDGVHCELSTDYHHLVLRNYLNIMQLARLNQVEMPTEMHRLLRKALEFSKYVHKPDGAVPALSDSDVRNFGALLLQGYELTGDEELLYVATQGAEGRAPAQRSRLFAESGYTVLRSNWGDSGEAFVNERYLVFDCGPLGAGNHGHLDLLSFEMAAYGRSLIVDPGRYTYHEPSPESGETNWRARFRGTGYHNTVQIDGKEQTRYEYHKTRFKIRGPAPDYNLKAVIFDDAFDFLHGIACSHEYAVTHERKILFARPWYWIVTDILRQHDPAEVHHYELGFHLSDEANGKVVMRDGGEQGEGVIEVDAPHLVLLHFAAADGVAAQPQPLLIGGYVSHTYGIKHAAPVVRFGYRGGALVLHTILYPYLDERPQIQATVLPVLSGDQPSPPTEAFALRVEVRQDEHSYTDTYFAANGDGQRAFSFAGHYGKEPLFFLRQQGSEREE